MDSENFQDINIDPQEANLSISDGLDTIGTFYIRHISPYMRVYMKNMFEPRSSGFQKYRLHIYISGKASFVNSITKPTRKPPPPFATRPEKR